MKEEKAQAEQDESPYSNERGGSAKDQGAPPSLDDEATSEASLSEPEVRSRPEALLIDSSPTSSNVEEVTLTGEELRSWPTLPHTVAFQGVHRGPDPYKTSSLISSRTPSNCSGISPVRETHYSLGVATPNGGEEPGSI